MGSLTASTPKPLLPLNGVPLIFYTLYQLWLWKIESAVINLHYLGGQIEQSLRNFAWFELSFSREERLLGTAGGIRYALPLLERDGPVQEIVILNPDAIILNPEPLPHFPAGASSLLHVLDRKDEPHAGWELSAEGRLLDVPTGPFFYSGYSLLRLDLIRSLPALTVAELGPIWREEARQGRLFGRKLRGFHLDLGDAEKYGAGDTPLLADPTLLEGQMSQWETFLERAR